MKTQRLDQYLIENRITVAEFARALGCHRSFIYRIMKGQAFPSREMFIAIKEATKGKVTSENFLGDMPEVIEIPDFYAEAS